MKRRKLSSEELKLWEKVAKSTLPLNEINSSETESFSYNEAALGASLKGMKIQLKDEKTRRKQVFSNTHQSKNGYGVFQAKEELEPEASLDLLGMNLNKHISLIKLYNFCRNTQKRLVLVITGKEKL